MAALAFEVDIEGRQRDDAEFIKPAVLFNLDGICFCRAFFYDHFVAHQRNFSAWSAGRNISRNDFQPHGGSLLAANFLHHIVQTHADNVYHFAVFALGHADDFIVRPDLLASVSRPAGDYLYHFSVIALCAELCADAFQRQTHIDAEVLRRNRRKIARVRVVGFGQCIHEILKNIVGFVLRDGPTQIVVALG